MAITSVLPASLANLRQYAASIGWDSLVNFSRNVILSLFSKVENGELRIHDTNGQLTVCGSLSSGNDGPSTELKVSKDTFWVRMLLFTDMVGSHYSTECNDL